MNSSDPEVSAVYARRRWSGLCGQEVLVEKDLFLPSVRQLAPAEHGILPPGLDPVVVDVFVPLLRNRQVGFLNPAPHFLIEQLLELDSVTHRSIGVAVLCFQIGKHVGVRPTP
jgi:hypothetical protein